MQNFLNLTKMMCRNGVKITGDKTEMTLYVTQQDDGDCCVRWHRLPGTISVTQDLYCRHTITLKLWRIM